MWGKTLVIHIQYIFLCHFVCFSIELLLTFEFDDHPKQGTKIKPLWVTAQLFMHPRYMHGAATR